MASLNDHGICLTTSIHFTIASWLPESGCKINHIVTCFRTITTYDNWQAPLWSQFKDCLCMCVVFVRVCILYCYSKFILYRLLILTSSCYIHISLCIFDLILYFSQTVLSVCTFLNYPGLVNLVLVILNIWIPILVCWLMIAIVIIKLSSYFTMACWVLIQEQSSYLLFTYSFPSSNYSTPSIAKSICKFLYI